MKAPKDALTSEKPGQVSAMTMPGLMLRGKRPRPERLIVWKQDLPARLRPTTVFAYRVER